jgi:ubiquinone/menaquinone biosynthesis C-methylase UbiE
MPSSERTGAEGSADFSFSAFARQPFYQEENARLVDLIGLKPGQQVVDLACGPGSVTKIILSKIRGARDSLIIGVDLSTQALQQARQEFASVRDAMVQFVQARAEDLSKTVKHKVDAVVFCNAIHLITNKEEVLAEIGRTLKPGGVFAFNTTFYHGSMPQETDSYYRRWMMRAIRLLKAEHGMQPDKTKVMARQQLTPEQYHALLASGGFNIARQRVHQAQVPLEGWLDICTFSDFVEGALPGVPVQTASEVLKKTVTQTFQDMQLTVVPRNWLEVVAVRA